ncbi:SbcC/MukB-like Walker B domain-containing protein [Streptomyces chiangmaiensis]
MIVVRVADEEGLLPVASFAEKIAEHRRDQAELLSDSEQRILEDALLTRLAQQIHDRTVDARDLIRRMNTDMRERRMSSGTTVGVSWLLADDLDDGQRAVCALLDADAARLGPEGLARIRAHFAAQIKNARARHRDLPYRELLAQVLDYRRWRQFAFQLVRPDKSEERLTRARHSRLSGGEQSVSLHLPLFAAAHAMLNSAHPHAPRLLALDEAFAGVDDTGRGELMSLAAQFDLDLFMTGYDLWAAHASVHAAAHYDLAHSAIDHTVSALLLLWDGERLLADGIGDLTSALGSPGTRRVPGPKEAAVAD